ncbi:MAG: hypothetical protein ACOX7N_01630 [Lawsonibacter sp.]|jgi:hypothetical protein
MAEASDAWAILHQNLMDAGCNTAMIRQCMALVQQAKEPDLLQLLSRYRLDLLDAVHEQQRKIDCLDFLLYQLKKGCLFTSIRKESRVELQWP